jgi:hypothetical protein
MGVTKEARTDMKNKISGTYKTTHWNEQEYSQLEGGPKLTVAENELALEGGIQGKGIRRYSVVHMTDGSNRHTGHMSITGRVGDREGSFVVEDSGMGSADGASGTWKIVAGSASGELAGLKGSGDWTWEKGSQDVAYTLSYEL